MLFSRPTIFHALCLWLLLASPIIGADDDGKPEAAISGDTPQAGIVLDEKTQRIAGLQTTALQSGQFTTETAVTGKAISIQPLVALHHRYLALLTEKQQAQVKLKQAEQNKLRQQDLYQHGVTARRQLQEHELRWQTEKSMLAANILQTKALVDEARLTWGDKLAAWAITNEAAKLADFIDGKAVLLQVNLPAGKNLSPDNKTIFVDAAGDRTQANNARLISEAPQIDTTSPGQSYFFQASGQIKPGMPVVAWITEQSQITAGVIIPKSAAVWSMDQLLVYIKTDKATFSRRLVNDYTAAPGGYLANGGFAAGEEIVTTGAQMLLSEEQRRQIPDEDD